MNSRGKSELWQKFKTFIINYDIGNSNRMEKIENYVFKFHKTWSSHTFTFKDLYRRDLGILQTKRIKKQRKESKQGKERKNENIKNKIQSNNS